MFKIDGLKFKEMLEGGSRALEINRDTIDSLNVFPVPDGDTGTNMSLTLASAVREANACKSLLVDEIADAFSKGALRGARGNSGVISSQIFKGFAVALAGKVDITPRAFAECLKSGAEIAYSAVTKPKEGTILTVIRVMAEEAEAAARGRKKVEFEPFLKRVIDAGEDILQKTPDMLPVLKKAGVVDAGGRGLVTVFDGMYRVLMGLEPALISGESVKIQPEEKVEVEQDFDILENDYEHITFQYCTEYFITHLKKEVTDAAIDRYREYLMSIGDCVLVIGDTELVKTHVHTNHPDRAINAALKLGELDGVKIENMVEQHRKLYPDAVEDDSELKEFAIVSVCAGKGLSDIFKDLGVDTVVEGGQTMNPAVDDILEAINGTKAKNVFVLPNNSNIILAANQAKELCRHNVFVVPTTSVPEGISAALAFNDECDAEENFKEMSAAFENVLSAEVTHAVRSTRINGFSVKEGDIIGICKKKIVAKSNSIRLAAFNTAKKLAAGKDMLTVYYGEGVDEKEGEELVESISNEFPDLEVACYYGGQPHYYYIISAE